jgi:parallel beta-helix repeat protein
MRTRLIFGTFLTAVTAAGLGAALSACGGSGKDPAPDCTQRVKPSSDDQTTVQTALINAASGDVICFDDGIYKFNDELSLTIPNVTLKGTFDGQGAILDFAGQTGGAKSIAVTADGFTVENLHLKNSPGDGIDVTGVSNVTFRNVLVSWDAGSVTANGAYGIFPVGCDHVIIENCEVTGASDAGIYVGQSNHVIVRNNKAHGNVAGIEFENTQDCEGYGNEAYDNAGGILVFNLPDLPIKDGRRCLIHDNQSHDNNRENFAKGGTIVASVPAGTGMIIMSADEIQVKNNQIHDNASTGVAVASYDSLPFMTMDASYDHFPETIYIHDNVFMHNGYDPMNILTLPGVSPLEDIVWDGRTDPNKDNTDGHLNLCIQNNGAATFRNIDDAHMWMNQSTDLTPHDCSFPELAPLTFG